VSTNLSAARKVKGQGQMSPICLSLL